MTCIRYNDEYECPDYFEYMTSDCPQIRPCDKCRHNLGRIRR